MPKSFPAEFRRRVLALVEAGRPVREVAADLEIAAARTQPRLLPQETRPRPNTQPSRHRPRPTTR
jgi:hypothetical protein